MKTMHCGSTIHYNNFMIEGVFKNTWLADCGSPTVAGDGNNFGFC